MTKRIPPVFADCSATISESFDVANPNGTEVRFAKIVTPCGCSTAELEDMVLPRGAHTTLRAKFDVRGPSGRRTMSVALVATEGPLWQFEVDVNVYRTLELADDAVIDFGRVEPNAPVSKCVVVRQTAMSEDGFTPLTRTSWHRDPEDAQLECQACPAGAPERDGATWRRETPVVVSLRAPALAGRFTASLFIQYPLPDGRPASCNVPVRATVESTFDTSEARAVFRVRPDGTSSEPETVTIRLRSRTSASFMISDVLKPWDNLSCDVVGRRDSEYDLVLRPAPSTAHAPRVGMLLVHTTRTEEPVVRIPVLLLPLPAHHRERTVADVDVQ